MKKTHYQVAKSIIKKFQDSGFTAYFAGGWVRDFCMHEPSFDIDIATDATVDETKQLFTKTVPVGEQFGIVLVVEEGFTFEVALFRKEGDYPDRRRPSFIEKATPEEDALRRDFTINGMFYDPLEEKIYDFVDGQKDIERKVIRAIGDPNKRIYEDSLRMIRAVRYAARFSFSIEENTKKAICAHRKDLFPHVAMERIWQELQKMQEGRNFTKSIELLAEYGLLQEIFVNLQKIDSRVLDARIQHLSKFPKNAPLISRLYALFPEESLSDRLQMCDLLKVSNKEKTFTEELEQWRYPQKFDDHQRAHIYAKPFAKECLEHIQVMESPATWVEEHAEKFQELQDFAKRIQEKNPVVKAKHLLDRGVPPGKSMGDLLQQAEKISINEKITNPEIILGKIFN